MEFFEDSLGMMTGITFVTEEVEQRTQHERQIHINLNQRLILAKIPAGAPNMSVFYKTNLDTFVFWKVYQGGGASTHFIDGRLQHLRKQMKLFLWQFMTFAPGQGTRRDIA